MSRSPSPVNFKKQQIGYVAATARDRCGNCNHVREDGAFWTCGKHALMVTVYAVCSEWTRKVPHGFKTPPTP